MSSKKEIVQAGKKIIYELYTDDNGNYEGLTVDILDMSKPILDSVFLSINPSEYVHSLSTNFNPYSNSHSIPQFAIASPAECYIIDGDLSQLGIEAYLKGNYLGNIVVNTHSGKQIVCFVSQDKDKNERYYKFLNLTGGNILACTEWDLNWEYLGIPSDEEGHNEYYRLLSQMKPEFEFTTKLEANNEEHLIAYNDGDITEEGIKKYNIFKEAILDNLKRGYDLLQTQEKSKVGNDDNCPGIE